MRVPGSSRETIPEGTWQRRGDPYASPEVFSHLGESVARAADATGDAIGEMVDTTVARREAADEIAALEALNAASSETHALARKYAEDPDYETAPDRFRADVEKAHASHRKKISSPARAARFDHNQQYLVESTYAELRKFAAVKRTDTALAALDTTIAQSQNVAVYGSPAQRLAAMQSVEDAIDGQVGVGNLTASKGVELKQAFANGVAIADVGRDARADPGATLRRLADPAHYPALTPIQREQLYGRVEADYRAQQARARAVRDTRLSAARQKASTALDVLAHGTDFEGAATLIKELRALGDDDTADALVAGREDLGYVRSVAGLHPEKIRGEVQAELDRADRAVDPTVARRHQRRAAAVEKLLAHQQKLVADGHALSYAESHELVEPTPLGPGNLPATATVEDREEAAKRNAAARVAAAKAAGEALGVHVPPLKPHEIDGMGRTVQGVDSATDAYDAVAGIVLTFEDPAARAEALDQLVEAKVIKPAQARQIERSADPAQRMKAREIFGALGMQKEQLNTTASSVKTAAKQAKEEYDDGIGQVWLKAGEIAPGELAAYNRRYDEGLEDTTQLAQARAQGGLGGADARDAGRRAEADLREGVDYIADDRLALATWPSSIGGKKVDPDVVEKGFRQLREKAVAQLAAEAEAEAAGDPQASGPVFRAQRTRVAEGWRRSAVWVHFGDRYMLVDPVSGPLALAGGQKVLVSLETVLRAGGMSPSDFHMTAGGF